jgi:hypothetical protein
MEAAPGGRWSLAKGVLREAAPAAPETSHGDAASSVSSGVVRVGAGCQECTTRLPPDEVEFMMNVLRELYCHARKNDQEAATS